MTMTELRALRTHWNLTQEAMAKRMKFQRRAYIKLETGEQKIREAHILIIERISIDIAAENNDKSYVMSNVRGIIEKLAI